MAEFDLSPIIHTRTSTDVASGIVAKALGGPRRGTIEKAELVLLMYCEIEKHAIVQEELIKGFAAKNPKVVVACVKIITTALRFVFVVASWAFCINWNKQKSWKIGNLWYIATWQSGFDFDLFMSFKWLLEAMSDCLHLVYTIL